MARRGVVPENGTVSERRDPPHRSTDQHHAAVAGSSSRHGIDVDSLLARLDADQRAAVTAPAGPVVVVAGAGSGKTRVLTSRIAFRVATGSAQPANVVAFTFTRQAAAELVRRLHALGIGGPLVAGTFHSVAYRILRRRWADRGRATVPKLVPSRLSMLTEQLEGDRKLAATAATEIEWACARLVRPDDYVRRAADAGRRPSIDPERIAGIFAGFEQYKRRRRLLDFEDLLSECIAELSRPTVADALSWWHRHLHVDEYQDINPLQHAFLEALRHRNDDLFVVGDPAQAIYGWNGADPELLAQLQSGALQPITVQLRTNYRSTPQIVAAGDLVLTANKQPAEHRAVRPTGESVVTLQATDELHEAAQIVRLARTMREPGAPWSSVAVLARTHDSLQRIAAAFAEARIPTRVVTRQRNPEGTAALLMGVARRADDPDALRAAVLDLIVPEDDPDESPADPTDQFDEPRDQSSDSEASRDPLEPVRSALDAVQAFEDAGGGDGRAFAAWLELNEVGHSTDDAVELVTMHASKGREWPAVIVAALDTVGFPTPPPNRRGARAEEVRLLYVALTRASDRLAVTWAARRNGAKTALTPLLPTLEGTAATAGLVRAEPPLRPSAPTPTADHRNAPLERLRAWRATNARAAGLPANFVLDDATLERIVDASPRNEVELAAVPGVGVAVARRFAARIIAALTGGDDSTRASQ